MLQRKCRISNAAKLSWRHRKSLLSWTCGGRQSSAEEVWRSCWNTVLFFPQSGICAEVRVSQVHSQHANTSISIVSVCRFYISALVCFHVVILTPNDREKKWILKMHICTVLTQNPPSCGSVQALGCYLTVKSQSGAQSPRKTINPCEKRSCACEQVLQGFIRQ